MLYNVNAGNLVIANGGTDSNSIEVGKSKCLTIYTPAAFTGTINLQGSNDDSTFYDIKSDGANIELAALGAYPFAEISSKYIRLHSGSAEGAARTSKCTMQEQSC